METSRIEAFSDGVLAIIITIMVLELRIPEGAAVGDLLRETGHAKNAMVVEYATTVRQRITPLEGFGYGERPYFSTILCYRGDEAWGQP